MSRKTKLTNVCRSVYSKKKLEEFDRVNAGYINAESNFHYHSPRAQIKRIASEIVEFAMDKRRKRKSIMSYVRKKSEELEAIRAAKWEWTGVDWKMTPADTTVRWTGYNPIKQGIKLGEKGERE